MSLSKRINYFITLFSSQKKLSLALTLYVILFSGIFLLLYFFGFYTTFPTEENLNNWDAMWYHSISTKGYEYYWYTASNSAFFPLFPYTWKLLHLNHFGISIFNFAVYVSGIFLICKTFRFELTTLLLYVSLPTGIFFFLPYSEAFFFLCSAVFLVGLKRNSQKMIFIGLLLASLTRATAMFFIPSIIVMEFLNSKTFLDKQAVKNILLYSCASILGLILVVLFQYSTTFEWFAFAKQQMKYWRHTFNFPGFPIVSHNGEKTLWMDDFAFFCGLSSTCILMVVLVSKAFFKRSEELFKNRALWFSFSYLFMVTLYSLFYNSKCLDAQTSVDSMSRYVFSTAFFCVVFVGVLTHFKISFRNYTVFSLLSLIAMYLAGMGTELTFFDTNNKLLVSYIFFIALLVYIHAHYFTSHEKYGKYFVFCIVTLNIILSTYAFHDFLLSNWVA